MIQYYSNFFNNSECEYFINLFKQGNIEYNGNHMNINYKLYSVDLTKTFLNLEILSNFRFNKLRVQMVNETIDQVNNFHDHIDPWSFIIFLNENFIGGEVVFKKKEFKPKKGDMIYFSGEEGHKVNNCIGDRYTLVGFMSNNPMEIKTII